MFEDRDQLFEMARLSILKGTPLATEEQPPKTASKCVVDRVMQRYYQLQDAKIGELINEIREIDEHPSTYQFSKETDENQESLIWQAIDDVYGEVGPLVPTAVDNRSRASFEITSRAKSTA